MQSTKKSLQFIYMPISSLLELEAPPETERLTMAPPESQITSINPANSQQELAEIENPNTAVRGFVAESAEYNNDPYAIYPAYRHPEGTVGMQVPLGQSEDGNESDTLFLEADHSKGEKDKVSGYYIKGKEPCTVVEVRKTHNKKNADGTVETELRERWRFQITSDGKMKTQVPPEKQKPGEIPELIRTMKSGIVRVQLADKTGTPNAMDFFKSKGKLSTTLSKEEKENEEKLALISHDLQMVF